MSTHRMIKDSFWTDTYVEELDPTEKLIFLYLLTNPLCNIAGIYEIKTKRIAYETGFDKEMVDKLLNRLVNDGKILRHHDWILIVNHAKHQSFKNPNVSKGIQRILDELPPEVKALKGFERLSHFTLLNLTLLNSTIPNGDTSKSWFSIFWETYPKKVGKGSAEKVWDKMQPDLALVLVALEKQKQSEQWQSDGGKFIPHPTTWLNQKRWEDEVEEVEIINLDK